MKFIYGLHGIRAIYHSLAAPMNVMPAVDEPQLLISGSWVMNNSCYWGRGFRIRSQALSFSSGS